MVWVKCNGVWRIISSAMDVPDGIDWYNSSVDAIETALQRAVLWAKGTVSPLEALLDDVSRNFVEGYTLALDE